jgi:alanyl-tRNA synthetase
VDSLLSKAESIAGITVLAAKVPASNMESLRYLGDLIKERLGSVVVVLAAAYNNRANFVAMVTPDLVARGLNAGQIVKQVAAVAGGSGGGRAELGQAGGKDKRKIDEALKLVRRLIEGKG